MVLVSRYDRFNAFNTHIKTKTYCLINVCDLGKVWFGTQFKQEKISEKQIGELNLGKKVIIKEVYDHEEGKDFVKYFFKRITIISENNSMFIDQKDSVNAGNFTFKPEHLGITILKS